MKYISFCLASCLVLIAAAQNHREHSNYETALNQKNQKIVLIGRQTAEIIQSSIYNSLGNSLPVVRFVFNRMLADTAQNACGATVSSNGLLKYECRPLEDFGFCSQVAELSVLKNSFDSAEAECKKRLSNSKLFDELWEGQTFIPTKKSKEKLSNEQIRSIFSDYVSEKLLGFQTEVATTPTCKIENMATLDDACPNVGYHCLKKISCSGLEEKYEDAGCAPGYSDCME